MIAKHLKENPTTERTAMQPQLAGIPPPDPSKPLPRPAVPKGWKMGEILPYYSAALSGGGISENLFKDMLAEMGGQMPGMAGMMDGPSSSAASEPKKKDKKKKIKG